MHQILKILIACIILFSGAKSIAQTHTYDPLNRLTQVSYPDGTTITYQYDKLGNRVGQTVVAGQQCTAPNLFLTGSGFTGIYRSQGDLMAQNANIKVADFVSDTAILLDFNFTVELGCDFDAYIQPCETNLTGPSPEESKSSEGKQGKVQDDKK